MTEQYETIKEPAITPLGKSSLYNMPSKIFGQISFLHPKAPMPSFSPPTSPASSSSLPPSPQDQSFAASTNKADYIHEEPKALFGVEGRSYQNIVVNTNAAPNLYGRRNNNPVPGIAKKLRIIILVSSLTTIGLESFSLLFKILSPTKFVLGLYIIILSALLFLVETHAKKTTKSLHANIGLLYNGYGRSFYFILLCSLCSASATTYYYGATKIIGILQYTLSLVYFLCAYCTFVLRWKYKEDLDDFYLIENDEIVDITANNFFWTDSSVYDQESTSLLAETR